MGKSLNLNYVHIVFSTKYRQNLIIPPYDRELYDYISGTCLSLRCPVLKIGGYKDHVHILCILSKHITIISLLEEIKTSSSKWMKTKHISLRNFYWQNGYGSFTVGRSELSRVSKYIEDQHAHHEKESFEDEYRTYLKKWNVTIDEENIWG